MAADDFARIFNAIEFHFDLSTCREVTFETNPDDLTEAYLRSIRMLPFTIGANASILRDFKYDKRQRDNIEIK